MVLGKSLHCLEYTGFQAGLVGAPIEGGDQVNVAFRLAAAFLEPSQRPGGALADGETVFRRDEFLADKNRRHRLPGHHFGQIIGHAVLVAPGLFFLAVDFQLDQQTGHQHGLGA